MHVGRSYRAYEFLAWSRRRIFALLIVSTVPVLLYQLADFKALSIPWSVVLLLGTTVALVAGFKNTGKTTLVTRLVAELTRRGLRISTVKHAHHSFDIDHEGRDSYRHREAGAREVAVVSRYADFEDALRQVNDSVYGLQAGIFTRDLYKAQRAWDVLEVGGVVVGDVPSWRVDHMPYGGVKDSGLGREGVRFAIEDMTEIRLLVVRRPS